DFARPRARRSSRLRLGCASLRWHTSASVFWRSCRRSAMQSCRSSGDFPSGGGTTKGELDSCLPGLSVLAPLRHRGTTGAFPPVIAYLPFPHCLATPARLNFSYWGGMCPVGTVRAFHLIRIKVHGETGRDRT